MILPIEKYKLLNQAYVVNVKLFVDLFSLQEKGITVKLSMGIINSNPKLPLKANIQRI